MGKKSKGILGLIVVIAVAYAGVWILRQASEKAAIEAGFANLQEYEDYEAAGFATMAEFTETGFENLEQAVDYMSAGFNSLDEFQKTDFISLGEAQAFKRAGFASKAEFADTGFANFEEAQQYGSAGFNTMKQFNESGFHDIEQASALKNFGETLKKAINSASEVSLDEFEACDRSGGSVYKNECFGKTVLWYAKVDKYADDGTYLDVVDSCEQLDSNSKAAWSKELTYDFWKQNDNACVQLLAEIRDENWATPTIIVKEVVWVEKEEAKLKRIALQERKEKEKAEAEEQARVAELEANKFNPKWLSDEFGTAAGFACKPFVEKLAKHTYRWTDGWLDTKFPSYLTSNKGEPYVLTVLGDQIEFQNGFGAWSKTKYYCKYHVKKKKVLDAWAR